jgi:alpha-tubulin suppressor-like RCC1 family protein
MSAKRAKAGTLRLTVANVPEGERISIRIKGPRLAKNLTKTAKLTGLRPGTYRVNVKPASVRTGGQILVPSFTQSKVSVAAGKTTRLAVRWGPRVRSVSAKRPLTKLEVGATLRPRLLFSPKNAANKTLAWKSSNPAAVRVDAARGPVATSPGMAKLTGTTMDGSRQRVAMTVHVVTAPGEVWAWGGGDVGQLGAGGTVEAMLPVRVDSLKDAVAVAAGRSTGYALRANGKVSAWGRGEAGQLGIGTLANGARPIPLAGLSNVVAIAAGFWTGYALRADGTVCAWGWGGGGQIGDGALQDRSAPVEVAGLDRVVAIDAGESTAYAVREDGTVWAWGVGTSGQLGIAGVTRRLEPAQVPGIDHAVAVAAGDGSAYALRSNGTVWAWGAGESGQLGDGSSADRASPAPVRGLAEVRQIAAAYRSAVAVRSDGTVWAWGAGSGGQLGNETQTGSSLPVQVMAVPEPVVAVAAGGASGYGLGAGGTVWSWGHNDFGQLGNDSLANRPRAAQVQGIGPAAAVAAGDVTAYAIVAPS